MTMCVNKFNGLKIIHLIDSGGLYGAEAVLLNLMFEQKKCGQSPILFSIGELKSNEKKLEAEAANQSLEVEKIRIRKGLNLAGSAKIIKTAREKSANIIHCHGYKANILMGITPVSKKRIPHISTLHGWTTTNYLSKKTVIQLIDLLCFKRADKIVVVSKSQTNHFLFRVTRLKPEIVNNGIPEIFFNAKEVKELNQNLYNFCKNNFIIGSIGRLSKEKGYDYLIQAFGLSVKKGIKAKLVILGEGTERKKLEKIIWENGLNDHILLPGYIENARNILPLFDIFILPSLSEGLPLTLLEAMQASRPCVATKVGGVPEVLENGKCGILVSSKSINELYKGILLLCKSEELRNKLGTLSRRRAVTKFHVSRMADAYNAIYEDLCK